MSGTDKLTNKIEEVSGKGKQAVGDATDNPDLQAEGQKEETKSNLKQAGENIKDAFKSAACSTTTNGRRSSPSRGVRRRLGTFGAESPSAHESRLLDRPGDSLHDRIQIP